jgi:hypothetical protein
MSPKSVAEKLLIKSRSTLWSSHPDRLEVIGPLPEGVRVVERPDEATTALVFGDDAESLRASLAAHGDKLREPDTLRVAYPKANRTDINRDTVWPTVAEYGMRPIDQVALSDVWSALRFRLLEPGEQRVRDRWQRAES